MTTDIQKEAEQALSKAKIKLMGKANTAFITTILFSLKQSWSTEIPTMMVNGVELVLNPKWFLDQAPDTRITALVHEAWHVALNHMARGRGINYDHTRFNKAADYVINLLLEQQGFHVPRGDSGWLIDDKYADMATEEVYEILPIEPPKDDNNSGGGSGWSPDFKANDGSGEGSGDSSKQEQIEQQIQKTIQQAAQRSKMSGDAPGTIPGEIEEYIDALLNPKLHWTVLLQNHVNGLGKDDYSFRRPNKRFMPEYYLPSAYSEVLEEVAVAVDTSGSVSNEEFAAFLSEIQEIKDTMGPKLTKVIDFDTKVQAVHELTENDDALSISFTGRGGTRLEPVFEHYSEGKQPTVLIVFSDLYCNEIEEDPGYPVIWVCIDNPNAKVNFGQLIHISKGELCAK